MEWKRKKKLNIGSEATKSQKSEVRWVIGMMESTLMLRVEGSAFVKYCREDGALLGLQNTKQMAMSTE